MAPRFQPVNRLPRPDPSLTREELRARVEGMQDELKSNPSIPYAAEIRELNTAFLDALDERPGATVREIAAHVEQRNKSLFRRMITAEVGLWALVAIGFTAMIALPPPFNMSLFPCLAGSVLGTRVSKGAELQIDTNQQFQKDVDAWAKKERWINTGPGLTDVKPSPN